MKLTLNNLSILLVLLLATNLRAHHKIDHHKMLTPHDWVKKSFDPIRAAFESTFLLRSQRIPDKHGDMLVYNWDFGAFGQCGGKVLGNWLEKYTDTRGNTVDVFMVRCPNTRFPIVLKRRKGDEEIAPLQHQKWIKLEFPDPMDYDYFELSMPEVHWSITSFQIGFARFTNLKYETQNHHIAIEQEDLNFPDHYEIRVMYEYINSKRGISEGNWASFVGKPISEISYEPRWYIQGEETSYQKMFIEFIEPLEQILESSFN